MPLLPTLPNELWWNIIAHAISLESNLAMIKPSSERLHPFFPGRFTGYGHPHFHASQLDILRRSNMVAHSFVQVNRLWRGIAERFLYPAFYAKEEWRVKRFIDTVKLNPILAKQLRTLIITPRTWVVKEARLRPLVEQVLSLCHGIVAIVTKPYFFSSLLPLFQFPDSSRRLLLLSATRLPSEEFLTLMINFNNYANLQVLELSVDVTGGYTLPSFPEHITFPSLHTLILGDLDPLMGNAVGKWELPSLKDLSIAQWDPLIHSALLPLIQGSYDRLELFSACVDILHDRAFYDIIRSTPLRLKNVTLNITPFEYSSPHMHPATKPIFGHVVTFGISRFDEIWPEHRAAWVRFFSDRSYMPHLRSVLTDVTASTVAICVRSELLLLDILLSFEEVLEARGVAFKGVTDDNSSFVPIKLLRRDALKVSMSLFSNASTLIFSTASHALHGNDER